MVNWKKMQLSTVWGLLSPNSMRTPAVPWDVGTGISPQAPPGDLAGPLRAVGSGKGQAPRSSHSWPFLLLPPPLASGAESVALPSIPSRRPVCAPLGDHGASLRRGYGYPPPSIQTCRGDGHVQAWRDRFPPPLRHKARETISHVHLLQHSARSQTSPISQEAP